MRKKATVETKVVSWNNNLPTKYQSILCFPASDDRNIRLWSSPQPSKAEAMEDLKNELMLWEEAVTSFKEALIYEDNY